MSTMTAAVQSDRLVAGDRLTLDEFLARWESEPGIKFAELIGGVVHMPSPLSDDHAGADNLAGTWLGTYSASTPGCVSRTNATVILAKQSPQPDVHLRLLPEFGGRAEVRDKLVHGPPELIVEVCVSSASYDLHTKLDLYRRGRVPEVVAVLVGEREVRWHRLNAGAYETIAADADGVLRSAVFPGLWLDAAALLAGDGRSVLATLEAGLRSPEHAAFVAELTRRS